MNASPELIITIDDLKKVYRHNTGILGISTFFSPGLLNLLIGGNGSGKTTLLKCIMGLVRYEGKIHKSKGVIGYAPEKYVMPEFMTINDFLVSIGRIRQDHAKRIPEYLQEYCDLLSLSNVMDKPIGKLSNGMKQKVNLLQAFIGKPRIYLFDEPLSSLDGKMKKVIVKIMFRLCRENIVIVSTHYPECFRSHTKRIYEIESGVLLRDGSN